jgi:hypothetical protein
MTNRNADVPPGIDESSPEWQAIQQGLIDEPEVIIVTDDDEVSEYAVSDGNETTYTCHQHLEQFVSYMLSDAHTIRVLVGHDNNHHCYGHAMGWPIGEGDK